MKIEIKIQVKPMKTEEDIKYNINEIIRIIKKIIEIYNKEH